MLSGVYLGQEALTGELQPAIAREFVVFYPRCWQPARADVNSQDRQRAMVSRLAEVAGHEV
jgi:hypothetical protein